VVGMTGTEYMELIEAAGCDGDDYPACQPIQQHLIWERVSKENCTPDAVENAIEQLKQTEYNFHMDVASWTNHLSWIKGYENVLTPINKLSALFHEQRNTGSREALLYSLLLQTSCFRYWAQGVWTDYAREIYRRGVTPPVTAG